MITPFRTFALALVLLAGLAVAHAAPQFQEAPPPPELDKKGQAPGQAAPPTEAEQEKRATEQEEALQPQVTIIKREHATIEEYRVAGKLRYVKITPAKGPPYYLFDTDGDGILETRSNDLDNPSINQWILFHW